jgi:hypothetical protein
LQWVRTRLAQLANLLGPSVASLALVTVGFVLCSAAKDGSWWIGVGIGLILLSVVSWVIRWYLSVGLPKEKSCWPKHPLGVGAFWVFSFALIGALFAYCYFAAGRLGSPVRYDDCGSPVSGCLNYFYFSIVAFSTLGFGDIAPSQGLARLLVFCEVTVYWLIMGTAASGVFQAAARPEAEGSRPVRGGAAHSVAEPTS